MWPAAQAARGVRQKAPDTHLTLYLPQEKMRVSILVALSKIGYCCLYPNRQMAPA